MRTITPLKPRLINYLSNSLEDCRHVLRQCHSIGKSLNSPTRRWLKAELIDRSYSLAFNQLDYVDEKGYDWMYGKSRISGKSQAKMFGKRNEWTGQVKISNKYGDSCCNEQMFDQIILTQSAAPFSIAVAQYSHVEEYFQYNDDGIVMQAPFDMLDFIVHPDEGIDFKGLPITDYSKQIDNMIDGMLLNILTEEPVCC
tara:strand:+ start:42 stop:635 length:594 start_codon:yes stop_codon:yes gene_type:complete